MFGAGAPTERDVADVRLNQRLREKKICFFGELVTWISSVNFLMRGSAVQMIIGFLYNISMCLGNDLPISGGGHDRL
ncbi:unnamed protein product [Macrosiphum euphorbiae]|nr:unnamed protein product [Macrosiphum euphorbiae]